MPEYRYKTSAKWSSEKRGVTEAESVPVKIDFSAAPEFRGEPGYWTPEHFLCGAVASCYLSTFRAIAEYSKFDYAGLEVEVEGVLTKEEGGFRFSEVIIRPSLKINREDERARAMRLLEKSERACLISRSLNGDLKLQPEIEVATAEVVR